MPRFRFPVPCSEPWTDMRPTPTGRHCDACDKTIVDLSRLTARDARLVVALSPNLCARLAATALVAACGSHPPPAKPEIAEVQVSQPASDPDPDRDGIASRDDLCAQDAEDKDSFEDEDGCPDLDNDRDKLLDAVDKCPNEPETYNGRDDDDGCPDRMGIVIDDSAVEIVDRVAFANNSARIAKTELVASIALLLKNNREFAMLHIRGHAAPGEKRRAALAKLRAGAVRDALVAAGVDPYRLSVDVVPPTAADKPEVDFHRDP